jgi:import inner membrane translocase subunit TIM9
VPVAILFLLLPTFYHSAYSCPLMSSFTPISSKGSSNRLLERFPIYLGTLAAIYSRPSTEIETSTFDRCFDDCINDFTSKALSTKEETCVSRCVDKFIKASDRLGQRFAEQSQAMQGGAATGAAGAGFGGR